MTYDIEQNNLNLRLNSELYISGKKCSTSQLPLTILFGSTEKYATEFLS